MQVYACKYKRKCLLAQVLLNKLLTIGNRQLAIFNAQAQLPQILNSPNPHLIQINNPVNYEHTCLYLNRSLAKLFTRPLAMK